jgi:hypothetical protein
VLGVEVLGQHRQQVQHNNVPLPAEEHDDKNVDDDKAILLKLNQKMKKIRLL